MKKNNFAHDRIKQTILIILCNTLKNEIYDNVVKQATFTDLDLNNDFSHAKIYVDTFDRKKIDIVVNALNKSKGVFRTSLSRQLTIRKIPELFFVKDKTIDEYIKIEKILNKIKNN